MTKIERRAQTKIEQIERTKIEQRERTKLDLNLTFENDHLTPFHFVTTIIEICSVKRKRGLQRSILLLSLSLSTTAPSAMQLLLLHSADSTLLLSASVFTNAQKRKKSIVSVNKFDRGL